MNLDDRIRRNLEQVARGGWSKLGREEQHELEDLLLVGLDDYGSPQITTTGTDALKGHA